MQFSDPWAMWLLLLLPLALLLGLLNERFAVRLRQTFAMPITARERWRMIARIALGTLAILALVMALAGPQRWALRAGDVRHNLVLAVGLDVSKSMLAEDTVIDHPLPAPMKVANRLNLASIFAVRLFEELAGEKASLFFFARSGIEVVAPTRDQGFLRYMVQHTRLADLTESGSDLAAAMSTGADLVASQEDSPVGAIVLISDGEDTENKLPELLENAKALGRRGTPVFTVGVGAPNEAFIPIRRPGATNIEGFYTDDLGRYLKTRLQEPILKAIATRSGGQYAALDQTSPQQLARTLLERIAQSVATRAAAIPRERGPQNLAPFLVAIALVLFSGYCLL